MDDREALAAHGAFCMSLAAGMAAGIVLNALLGLVLFLNITAIRGGDTAGSGMLWLTVLPMKAGAVLGAVVGCWALHRLYWRCDDATYRRRCSRVGLVLMFEIIAAAALLLGIALVQPAMAMAMFWSPLVLALLCMAWLFHVVFVGHVMRMNLLAKLMSSRVGQLDRNALDNPQDSAGQMISGLTRLALSPFVAVKTVFQGFIGLLDGCMHIDLGNGSGNQRKKPLGPS